MKPPTENEQALLDRILSDHVTDARSEAERKAFARLYTKGWVKFAKHHGGRYYYLSYRATRHFRIHRCYSEPPGYSCLVRAIGTAALCRQLGYERLSAWQFERRFPELCGPNVPQGQYCLRGNDFGCVHIDVAQPAKRIIRRVREIIAARNTIPAFRPILDEGRFFVVVGTPTKAKQRQLDNRLDGLADVVVVPELLEVLL
jgi:hypothetical protein